MKIAISASGSRYITKNLEWWTKTNKQAKNEGILLHHMPDGSSGEIIELCKKN